MKPLNLKICWLCLNLLLYPVLSSAQWSSFPVINDFNGAGLSPAYSMTDSSFCKGGNLTLRGDHFLDSGIAEIWDSLRVWIGGFPGGDPCLVTGLDSTTIDIQIPDIFINDTCLTLTIIKYTHSIFGIHPYPVNDTICLVGDFVEIVYPDSVFCLGDSNPIPTVLSSQTTSGGFCCTVGASGFLVLPDGSIPLHTGAMGQNNSFQFISAHPACPETLSFSVDILPKSTPIFGFMGGDSIFCPVATAQVDTAQLWPSGGSFRSEPPGLIFVDDSLGIIDLGNSHPGTYQLWYRPVDLCHDSAYHLIQILEQDNSSFVYNPPFYCTGDPDPLPQILGDGGGTFSALSAGTVVAIDGRLDLQASGPGNHTIKYLTPGTCPDSSVFTVTINNGITAFFSYSDPVFCTSDSNPLPQISTQGGIFSGGVGLVLDSLSGEIDLGSSTPGVYTVTYSFSGSCQSSFSQTISLSELDTLTSIDFGPGPFCQDSTPAVPVLIGDSIGSFLVSGGAVFFNPANGSIDLSASLPGGPYIITYDIQNQCAIDPSDTITISQAPETVLLYPDREACPGDAPLSVNPDNSILPNGAFSASPGLIIDSLGTAYPDPSIPGSHLITYTTTGNCPNEVSTSITIHPAPSDAGMTIFPNDSVCEGETIRASLSGSDAVAFGFLVNGVIADSSFFVFEADTLKNADLLTGYVRNAFGCTDSFPHHLVLSPRPEVSIRVPNGIITGTEALIELSANLDSTQVSLLITESGEDSLINNLILPVAGEAIILSIYTGRNRLDPGRIHITAFPMVGTCPGDSSQADLMILETPFFIPEVITPNGDGANDTWMVSFSSGIDPRDYEMKLFNRTGGEVFSMSPLHQSFDGGSLPDGVYWWVLRNWNGKAIQQGGLTIRR